MSIDGLRQDGMGWDIRSHLWKSHLGDETGKKGGGLVDTGGNTTPCSSWGDREEGRMSHAF